jgi:3-hydroxymyristoyl/3-hydroxydecanoyl-(acyl carrier protein) dehydratase
MPGNKGQVVYLASANNLKFSKKVVPGDKLIIKTKLQSWKRGVGLCSGIGEVNNNLACKADFTLVLPILLNEYISKS